MQSGEDMNVQRPATRSQSRPPLPAYEMLIGQEAIGTGNKFYKGKGKNTTQQRKLNQFVLAVNAFNPTVGYQIEETDTSTDCLSCPVCFTEFGFNQPIKVLKCCGTLLCAHCFHQWMSNSEKCCRCSCVWRKDLTLWTDDILARTSVPPPRSSFYTDFWSPADKTKAFTEQWDRLRSLTRLERQQAQTYAQAQNNQRLRAEPAISDSPAQLRETPEELKQASKVALLDFIEDIARFRTLARGYTDAKFTSDLTDTLIQVKACQHEYAFPDDPLPSIDELSSLGSILNQNRISAQNTAQHTAQQSVQHSNASEVGWNTTTTCIAEINRLGSDSICQNDWQEACNAVIQQHLLSGKRIAESAARPTIEPDNEEEERANQLTVFNQADRPDEENKSYTPSQQQLTSRLSHYMQCPQSGQAPSAKPTLLKQVEAQQRHTVTAQLQQQMRSLTPPQQQQPTPQNEAPLCQKHKTTARQMVNQRQKKLQCQGCKKSIDDETQMISSSVIPCCNRSPIKYLNYVHRECAFNHIMLGYLMNQSLSCQLCGSVLTVESYATIVSFLSETQQAQYKEDLALQQEEMLSLFTPGTQRAVQVSEQFIERIMVAARVQKSSTETLVDTSLWSSCVVLGVNTILYAASLHQNFANDLMFFDNVSSHQCLKFFPRLDHNQVNKDCFRSKRLLMLHYYEEHYFMSLIYIDQTLRAKVFILDSANTNKFYLHNVQTAMQEFLGHLDKKNKRITATRIHTPEQSDDDCGPWTMRLVALFSVVATETLEIEIEGDQNALAWSDFLNKITMVFPGGFMRAVPTIECGYVRQPKSWIIDFIINLTDICFDWYDLEEVRDGLQDLVQEYWGVGNEGSPDKRIEWMRLLTQLYNNGPAGRTFRETFKQLSPPAKDQIQFYQTWRNYHGKAPERSVNNRVNGVEVQVWTESGKSKLVPIRSPKEEDDELEALNKIAQVERMRELEAAKQLEKSQGAQTDLSKM